MAWISVHDSLYGPKLRELYHRLGCSEFEAVGLLVSLWMWGLQNATAEGKIPHTGRADIERYLYSRSSGSATEPGKVVEALFQSGWLEERESDIYIHDWLEWQRPVYKDERRRASDSERQRKWRQHKNATQQSDQLTLPEVLPGNSPEQIALTPQIASKPREKAKTKRTTNNYPQHFLDFWEVYPRKDDKGTAYKNYQARLNNGFSEEELLAAAEKYAAQCKRNKTEKKFIKQPGTFLSANMPFLDFLPKDKNQTHEPDNGNPFAKWMDGE